MRGAIGVQPQRSIIYAKPNNSPKSSNHGDSVFRRSQGNFFQLTGWLLKTYLNLGFDLPPRPLSPKTKKPKAFNLGFSFTHNLSPFGGAFFDMAI